jgi:hypothetical protein
MNYSLRNQEHLLRQDHPLIVLGMHRSGTSLMVRLLDDLGVHMGRRLSRDAEAIFFQKINRRIFQTVGAKWGFVDPLIKAMHNKEFIEQRTAETLRYLFPERNYFNFNPGISDFFGKQHWETLCQGKPGKWGWKDPRTTITFPIWMQIFPQARVLHILRNGVDVAISTHRRTKRQKRRVWKQIVPLDYCPITLDFYYCFRLWETYVSFVYENKNLVPPDQYLEIHYEDLLAEPEAVMRRVLTFSGYWVEEELIATACRQVNRGRLDNSNYAEDYRELIPPLKSSALMRRLGYG